MKSQLAEVQTGLEPLFFHIQVDFCGQPLFQSALEVDFWENRRKILHKVMGAGLLVLTDQ